MAKGNARQQAAARRDKRAKLMLGVFGLVFLAVVGFEVPHFLKHGSSPSAASTTGTTASSTTAAGGVAAAPGVTTSQLQAATQPQSGQLVRFSEFSAKDPFHPQVNPDAGSSSSGSSSSGSGSSGSSAGASTTPSHPIAALAIAAKPAAAPKTQTVGSSSSKPRYPTTLVPAAVLRLDGWRHVVAVGATFPAKKPAFRLAAVGRDVMWISLLHGTFAGGQPLLQVKPGHPTELVDSTTKTTYLLTLVRVTAKPIRTQTSKTTSKKSTTTSSTTTTVTGGQTSTTTSTTSTTTSP
jgi:hypothetical protein